MLPGSAHDIICTGISPTRAHVPDLELTGASNHD
jgi:hypothetical protein